MPDSHPTADVLSAFSLGMLSPDEASAVEQHVSDCEPCCETMIGLAADDTFVNLVQRAGDPSGSIPNTPRSSDSDSIPSVLAEHPRYDVVRLIGHGGMGDVYEARHRLMNRTVALKVINRELVARTEVVERFRREVEAAAQLSHPNIVTAHDAEQAGHVHFLVMEHVDGTDLSRIVKKRGPLPVREACEFARQAAIGLDEAHCRGLIHRDIKPHNLMVTADGTVKILDFGLASLVPATPDAETIEGRSDLTSAGTVMGTPDFISPEQAADARHADVRSDVYSLGATLYFLLTGRPLFTVGNVVEKLRSHAEAEPDRLDTVRDDLPAGLADVVARMIAKDPAERFQTAAEVAEALEEFGGTTRTTDVPTTGERSPSRRGPASRLMAVAGGLAALVAAAVYFVVTNNGVVRIEVLDDSLRVRIDGREVTLSEDGKTVQTFRAGDHEIVVLQGEAELVTDAFELRRNGDVRFRVTVEEGQVVVSRKGERSKTARLPGQSGSPLERESEPEPSDERQSVNFVASEVLRGHHGQGVDSLAFSPDGELLASASQLKVFVRKTSNGEVVTEFGSKGSVVFHPEGKLLAAVNLSGVSLWEIPTGKKLRTFEADIHPFQDCYGVAFSPDGRRLAVGADDGLVVWDVESGRELHSINAHLWNGNMTDVAFSPDGTRIASANWGGHVSIDGKTVKAPREVKVWDAETGKRVATLLGGGYGVAFSPDGKTIASGNYFDGTASVWDVATEKELHRLHGHQHGVAEVAFSPDGRWLATAGRDNLVKIWNTRTWLEAASLPGHENIVRNVTFSPDGKRLYSSSDDKTIRVWDVTVPGEPESADRDNRAIVRDAHGNPTDVGRSGDPSIRLGSAPFRFGNRITSLEYSTDGTRLLSSGGSWGAAVWDAKTGDLVRHVPEGWTWTTGSLSRDGTLVATAGYNARTVRIRSVETGDVVGTIEEAAKAVRFDPDGRSVFTVHEGTLARFDVSTGERQSMFAAPGAGSLMVAVAPTGTLVAGMAAGGDLRIWDWRSGKQIAQASDVRTGIQNAKDVVFTPDGESVVVLSKDGGAELRNARTLKVTGKFPGDENNASTCLNVSADGSRVVFGSLDGLVFVHDLKTGKLVKSWRAHTKHVSAVALSPDGSHLACGTAFTGSVRIWNVDTLRPTFATDNRDGVVGEIAVLSNGKTLIAENELHRFDRWDLAKGERTHSWWWTGVQRHHVKWALCSKTGRTLSGYRSLSLNTNPLAPEPTVNVFATANPPNEGMTIRAVALSADGRFGAAATEDDRVCVCDLLDSSHVRTFTLPKVQQVDFGTHARVALSADGGLLAGSSRNEVRLWEVKTGRELRAPTVEEDVTHIAFSPDGTRLALAGRNQVVVHDIQRGEAVTRIADDVGPIAFSPDGLLIATGGHEDNDFVKLWETKSGREVRQVRGALGGATSLAFSPDGEFLYAGTASSLIFGWDLSETTEDEQARGEVQPSFDTDRFIPTPFRLHGRVHALEYSPDGKQLLASGSHWGAALFDANSGEVHLQLPKEGMHVTADFSPDAKRIALAEYHAGDLPIWDVKSGKEVATLPMCRRVARFSSDGRLLFTVSAENLLTVYDLETEKTIDLDGDRTFGPDMIATSPKGTLVAAVARDGKLRVWDWSTKERLAEIAGAGVGVHNCKEIVFTPDGESLVILSQESPTELRDARTLDLKRTFDTGFDKFHSYSLAVSGNGERLAIGCEFGHVVVFDVRTGERIHTRKVRNDYVAAVALSPDGRYLACGSEVEGGIHVLDVEGRPGPAVNATLGETAPISPALRHLLTVATPEDIDFEDADIRISDDQSLVLVGKNGEHLLTIDEKQRTARAQPVSGWRGMKFVPGDRRIVAKTWGEAFVRDPDEPLRAYLPMPHVMVEGDWIDPAVSSDGTILATRPKLDHVQFWRTETLRSSGEPLAMGGHVERMQFTSDSNYLCTHTTQGLSLWNPRSGQRVAGPFRDGPYIHGLMGEVAYDPIRERVATVENFGHDAATDMGSRIVVRPLRPDQVGATNIEVPAHTTCVRWAGPNHLIVSGGRHKAPRELDGYRYGTFPLFVIRLDDDSSGLVELARHIWYYPVLTPDGRYVIGASNVETLCWKVGEDQPLWRTPGRSKVIEATNDCILLHGFDGRVKALAAGTGESLREWRDVVRTRIHGDRLWLFGEDAIQVWAFEAGDPAPEQGQPGAGDQRSDRSDPSSNG